MRDTCTAVCQTALQVRRNPRDLSACAPNAPSATAIASQEAKRSVSARRAVMRAKLPFSSLRATPGDAMFRQGPPIMPGSCACAGSTVNVVQPGFE